MIVILISNYNKKALPSCNAIEIKIILSTEAAKIRIRVSIETGYFERKQKILNIYKHIFQKAW